jgi:serine/threonine-protein kinase
MASADQDNSMDQFTDADERLAVLIADLTDRLQRGEPVDLDEQCELHPDLSDELQYLWGTAVVTDAIGLSEADDIASQLNGSESGSWNIQLPLQMGEYTLIRELGRGGMGVVYLARQSEPAREVAIKMILRERLTSPADRLRFLAEAEATARLEHPGIVPVYEVGDFEGMPFFSMQFVKGQTLADMLASGRMPQRETARIMIEVCRAVEFAHSQGLLHRDIKPSNIMVEPNGSVRLTDFGLVKDIEPSESLTRTGAVMGTPNYMSPEQANGRARHIGPASDIYSIGSVLYHALTGQPPFSASTPVELALKVMEQEPTAPRKLEPKIDRDLEMIVTRCLQKPADLRYVSAGALEADLQAFLRDEPVAARSGQFAQIVARVFRETHHAEILENWGLLWMWHSLVLLIACLLTTAIEWSGTTHRWPYAALWTIGLGAWAGVFWALRRRMGPVTFVERQIAHVWGASMIAIAMLFPFEWWLALKPLTLSPLLGIVSGMVFVVKGGMLSGAFYTQAGCLFASAIAMAVVPEYAHLIFGVVGAGCFFLPGLKYYRLRLASQL